MKKQPYAALRPFVIITIFCSLFVACSKKDAMPTEFFGESMTLGSGTAKAYYRTDASGNPMEVGVIISDAAMNSLPHATSSTVIQLPAEAQAKTPFKFLLFDYNHLGHEPAHVYDLPHFDIHVYTGTNEERLKINPSDASTAAVPSAGFLPADYVIPGGVVPQMGNHWIDVTAPEVNGAKFTNTFIYGSTNGKIIFYEPMITSDFILATTHAHFVIKQPAKFEKSGYFPSEYCVLHNTAAKQYEISLQEFAMK